MTKQLKLLETGDTEPPPTPASTRVPFASMPEAPEDMLPWLIGRFAAHEELTRKRFEVLESKLDSVSRDTAEIKRIAPGPWEKRALWLIAILLTTIAARYGLELPGGTP
jgi:hypothetical protein